MRFSAFYFVALLSITLFPSGVGAISEFLSNKRNNSFKSDQVALKGIESSENSHFSQEPKEYLPQTSFLQTKQTAKTKINRKDITDTVLTQKNLTKGDFLESYNGEKRYFEQSFKEKLILCQTKLSSIALNFLENIKEESSFIIYSAIFAVALFLNMFLFFIVKYFVDFSLKSSKDLNFIVDLSKRKIAEDIIRKYPLPSSLK